MGKEGEIWTPCYSSKNELRLSELAPSDASVAPAQI